MKIKQYKELLDIATNIERYPDKAMTILADANLSYKELNFLRSIDIADTRGLDDYIEDFLQKQSIFEECSIRSGSSFDFHVRVNPEKCYQEDFEQYAHYDSPWTYQIKWSIIMFNLRTKTYRLNDTLVPALQKLLESDFMDKHPMKIVEMPRNIAIFGDLSFKARIKNAFHSFHLVREYGIERISTSFKDFFTWVFLPCYPKLKKNVEKAYQSKQKQITEENNRQTEYWKELIVKQATWKEYIPKYIGQIQENQKQIVKFLKSYGYTEDKNLEIYPI